MRILFTDSSLYFTHGHTFLQPDWPTLAGIVGNKHEVRLFDNTRSFFRSNMVLEEVKKFKPDVVGISIIAATDIFNTLEVISRLIQKKGAIFIDCWWETKYIVRR